MTSRYTYTNININTLSIHLNFVHFYSETTLHCQLRFNLSLNRSFKLFSANACWLKKRKSEISMILIAGDIFRQHSQYRKTAGDLIFFVNT